jgi:AMP nucleosidase
MLRFVAGEALPGRVRACYPFVRVHTHTVSRQSAAGHRRPELRLRGRPGPLRDHADAARPVLAATTWSSSACCWRTTSVELEMGTSTQPIPIHFSFAENDHIEGTMSAERRA